MDKLGIFTPKARDRSMLDCGEVGFVVAGIKDIEGAPVGDTLTLDKRPAAAPLPGFKAVHPQVYAGMFPTDSNEFEGRQVFDMSFIKNSVISEGVNLEFRAEFFNVFNHPNFATPTNSVLTAGGYVSTTGRITRTVTTSRQIQFGLKVLF